MTTEMLQTFLGGCTLINAGLLAVWAIGFGLAHDVIYRLHSKLFQLSVPTFDQIHYAGMTAYKLALFLLNLVPYCVLRWVL
jgi:hypothetical protein